MMIKKATNPHLWFFLSILILTGSLTSCSKKEEYKGYLFAYFTGNGPGEEQIHYAISEDGYNFRALNNNQPIIDSKVISSSGGVRDPHILRCEDGNTFYMVVTDLYVPNMGWNNKAMTLLKSTDLINWQSTVLNIPELYPEQYGQVNRVWAPQTIYDKKADKYMVYFSMRTNNDPDIIYYAYANKDFTGFEEAPKQLYFSPTNNACIDGDIVEKDGKFYFFFKSEDGKPGIKLAISDKLTEGYVQQGSERVDKETQNVEGSCVFKLNNTNEWILMYDVYNIGKYQFTKTTDLKHFEIIDHEVTMNFHPRHGTIISITQSEMEALIGKWGSLSDPIIEPTSNQLKHINVNLQGDKKTIHLPVKTGTDLTAFDPEFKCFSGFSFTPAGPQDFTKGSVTYTLTITGKGSTQYTVTASEDHNPVIEGYYADPEILYSEKTGKYYIYPTSDGFWGWSGTYFKVFSSDDLVNWKEENVIIDLDKDVSWANRNAWAPCIVEKKINGEYKYFYYFTAAQKIGVAVADNPTGPFIDSGKPFIGQHPKGINHGQVIDPDVFTDPKTGKSYIYWGNGYLAGAELNNDMVSYKEKTLKIMTPDRTFREGAYVIYRNGTYYFMWSEDDTRSPNYRVRYATAKSPLGKLTIPENNIVIEKDPEQGIYGTGHNSAIQIPGTDDWYLVYHRFTLPKGITMGRPAGFHRETCIDKLQFDEEGNIIQVKPTLHGIEPIK
nr:family 43 glycosylhydrolase [uncultured Carboxylicivirga sp.]